MENIKVKDIVKAVGGRLLCGEEETILEHISIDSRSMKGSDLFVPLVGEKNDAHRFIDQAFLNGAAAVLTSEHDTAESENAWIRVDDTKKALQDIGAYYRKTLKLPLIGVTGSVGKTSTREMIAEALSGKYNVYRTPANHNSQVGVPVTLSEITSENEIGVIELGMSEPGEMSVIAKIAAVNMAVITNIGVAHIEQLETQENILREKMCIQDGMKSGGVLFLNGDDEFLKNSKAEEGIKTVYYGFGENCSYRAVDVEFKNGRPEFCALCNDRKIRVKLKVPGEHNVLNAMAALAAADYSGVPLEAAAEKLSEYTGFKNRQQIYNTDGITIIDDTYNASPSSMHAAIDVLCSLNTEGRRIAVLADMKELGENSKRFHFEIGEYAGTRAVDEVVTLGELAAEIANGAVKASPGISCKCFDEKTELTAYLKTSLRAGDSVLLKGSNSMNLKETVDELLNK